MDPFSRSGENGERVLQYKPSRKSKRKFCLLQDSEWKSMLKMPRWGMCAESRVLVSVGAWLGAHSVRERFLTLIVWFRSYEEENESLDGAPS